MIRLPFQSGIIGCTALLALALVGCGDPPSSATAPPASAGQGTPDRFELSAEAVAKSELATQPAGKHGLRISVTVPAQVLLDDRRSAHVVTTLDGVVREVLKHPGDSVAAGEVLAVMDSRELADAVTTFVAARTHTELAAGHAERSRQVAANAVKLRGLLRDQPQPEDIERATADLLLGEQRATLIAAYARLRAATATFEREKALQAKKISPAADFALAEEELAGARARYVAALEDAGYSTDRLAKEAQQAAIEARLGLAAARQKLLALGLTEQEIGALTADSERPYTRCALRSPIAGTVLERRVALGESVAPGHDAFFVADLSRVVVQLAVPADQLGKTMLGRKVVVSGPAGSAGQGELSYLAPVVDDKTGSALARCLLANDDGGWRPGMFVSAEIVIDEGSAALAVPHDAIQDVNGTTVVFVQDGTAFRVVPVKVGRRDASISELLEGSQVKPGDLCVVRNSFVLKAHLLSLGGG